jgi:hypothetical protein
MVNQEHLAILRQGADHWNEWLRTNPDSPPNLDGISLEDFDLSGLDLSTSVFVA